MSTAYDLKSSSDATHRIALPKYTLSEELMSAISHGMGALLSVAGLVLCLVKAARSGSALEIIAAAIYGCSLILLYTMSCLYHSFRPNKAKRVFRVFDHCTIFILIFGSYTPFTLITLHGTTGWILFGVILAAAIVGIVLNAVNLKKFAAFSMVCYLAMGWAVIFTIRPLLEALPMPAFWLLVAGGVVYSLGCIPFAIGRKVKYMHSLWHLFVLGGSILHFFAVYLYVL